MNWNWFSRHTLLPALNKEGKCFRTDTYLVKCYISVAGLWSCLRDGFKCIWMNEWMNEWEDGYPEKKPGSWDWLCASWKQQVGREHERRGRKDLILDAWVHARLLQLCLTLCDPWTVACQAPLSMGFSRREYWSGLPYLPPGDFPDPGIKLVFLLSPAWAGRFFTTNATTLEYNHWRHLRRKMAWCELFI